jgi:hypothetical protein
LATEWLQNGLKSRSKPDRTKRHKSFDQWRFGLNGQSRDRTGDLRIFSPVLGFFGVFRGYGYGQKARLFLVFSVAPEMVEKRGHGTFMVPTFLGRICSKSLADSFFPSVSGHIISASFGRADGCRPCNRQPSAGRCKKGSSMSISAPTAQTTAKACLQCPDDNKRPAGTRGLCSHHYKKSARKIMKGKTTWQALESAGRAVRLGIWSPELKPTPSRSCSSQWNPAYGSIPGGECGSTIEGQ